MLSKLFKQILRRKLTTGIALLVIAGGAYFGYQGLTGDITAVEYVTAAAERGTLVSSISGAGQVSVSDQVDVTPKVSGEITVVYVAQGQEVKAGTLLAQIDNTDAERAVRDAETSLETAKLELDKLLEPADELDLLQAENTLVRARESKQKTEDNIIKAYEDGFNTVANALLDLPEVMAGLEDMLFDNTIDPRSGGGDNITWYINQTDYQNGDRDKAIRYRDDVYDAYNEARLVYTKNFDDYKSASRFSDQETIEKLINQTYDTTKLIAEAVKVSNNYIDFVQDGMERRDFNIPSMVYTHQSLLDSYTGTTNSNLLSLLSIQRSIQDSREALVDAERSIEEKELSLAKAKQDPDDLDIRAKKITIQQREDALLTAKQNLAKYFVRAPFGGVVARVNTKRGDSVSSGTTLATLITKQKLAEISLNEVDVASIEIGQKATLTFDAVEEFTITGEVAEIDSLGVVSQGVVSYNVKIAFDTQDDRIKPGMTTNASIITDRKDNIVLVPNAAVQSRGGQIFVEIMQDGVPQSVPVEVGISNEIATEIVSGLESGAQVVTARLGGEGSSQTANVSQSLRIPGLGGGGGGFRGGGGGGGFVPH